MQRFEEGVIVVQLKLRPYRGAREVERTRRCRHSRTGVCSIVDGAALVECAAFADGRGGGDGEMARGV